MRGFALLIVAARAFAGEPSADEIILRSIEHLALRDFAGEMRVRMVLERGSERRERALVTKVRHEGGLARTRVEFVAPADVAGTRFLVIANAGREDDQYVWLPALHRVRRIAGSQKNASFMGSDFTYADLEGRDTAAATHRLLQDETVDGAPAWVIESVPREGSAYAKLVSRVRKSDFVPLRVEYFTATGTVAGASKTLRVVKTSTVGGKLLVTESRMQSADGHATTFYVDEAKPREDLPAAEFTVERLGEG